MAVRNFWIEVEVDGRKTPVALGPVAKDGGFELTVYVRDAGESVEAATIVGCADNRFDPDALSLYVSNEMGMDGGFRVKSHRTDCSHRSAKSRDHIGSPLRCLECHEVVED